MKIPDYHVHPDFSLDARGKIRDYVQFAQENGLEEICFTTHLDLDPVRSSKEGWVRVNGTKIPNRDPSWVEKYLEEIENAGKLFPDLKLKKGLEVDFFPGVLDRIGTFLNFPWDYLLVSVHCINHLAVAHDREGAQLISIMDPETITRQFSKEVKEAIKSGIFHGIAHLDYFKRQANPWFQEKFLALIKEELEEILLLLKEQKMALEINARAMYRYNLKEPFPGLEVLSLASSLGVEIITFGSDSHNPLELEKKFDTLAQLAMKAGFKGVYTFSGGKIERWIPFTQTEPLHLAHPS
ncbi:MAG: histidinol-phosphatase HisJ family protein [Caldiserica bacterium]|jgi:histidinol-phosphatase (PHP family)|nr:histidinol-phosphatase HisJ family protein [Caldisericota bacterium]MDH7562564.1 histidinol-phosphatase HisJ family protein [Caldisericota bacterium]